MLIKHAFKQFLLSGCCCFVNFHPLANSFSACMNEEVWSAVGTARCAQVANMMQTKKIKIISANGKYLWVYAAGMFKCHFLSANIFFTHVMIISNITYRYILRAYTIHVCILCIYNMI